MTLDSLANEFKRLVEADAALSYAKTLTTSTSLPPSKLSKLIQRAQERDISDAGAALLANLKEARNSLAPISYLPDELLAEVFYCVSTAESWSVRYPSALLVCRRWHRIGMGTSRLWTFISNTYPFTPRATRAWEKRSKAAPLSLDLDIRSSRTKILHRNQDRVRRLRLHGNLVRTLAILEPIIALPILEALTVIDSGSLEDFPGGGGETMSRTILSPRLFEASVAPLLLEVHFESVYFAESSDFQVLRNLTSLSLTRDILEGGAEGAVPTLPDIHAVLQSSPQLQRLKISHYLGGVAPDALPYIYDLPTVFLPSLRSLDIEAESVIATSFLRLLQFPPSCQSDLFPMSRHTQNHEHFDMYIREAKQFFAFLTKHLNQPTGAPIFRSAIIFCRVNSLHLSLSTSTDPDTLRKLGTEDPELCIQLFLPTKPSHIRKTLIKLFKALPLDDLEILHAANLPVFPSGTWKELFRILPPNLVVAVGINQGMIRFMDGVLSAMIKSPSSHPNGRRLRRKTKAQGLGYAGRPLRGLVLSATPGSSYRLQRSTPEQIAEEATRNRQLFEALYVRLREFIDIDTPGKPGGGKVEVINVTGFEQGCRQMVEIAPRFSEVVDGFYLWDRAWGEGADREAVRGWKREWRGKQPKPRFAFERERGESDSDDE